MILNETPVRTAKNFNINNIKLENLEIPRVINEFKNLKVVNNNLKIDTNQNKVKTTLTYGLGEILTKQVIEKSNQRIQITIDSKTNQENEIIFELNKSCQNLVENIEIVAEEGAKSTIIIKYKSDKEINVFHNGILKLYAKENSKINIILVNFLNEFSNNFISIENQISDNAEVNYTIVDFGGKNSITNYYSNLIGDRSYNEVNAIYLGKKETLNDLNYIGELRGEESKINIEVQGALKDKAQKQFKGTIDFKKGCKKAKGNENEYCMLLSENTKSRGLPMLLCSEEDVEGNHASSAGKIEEKELFYIMSRGLTQKEAMKLMVRAKFNKIIETIKNEQLKQEILDEIDTRLE